MESNDLVFLFLGVALIVFGAGFVFDGGYYSTRFGLVVNFGSFNQYFGLCSVVLGVGTIWGVLRKR